MQTAFVGERTSVVSLEPARINQETEALELGRGDFSISSQGRSGQFFS